MKNFIAFAALAALTAAASAAPFDGPSTVAAAAATRHIESAARALHGFHVHLIETRTFNRAKGPSNLTEDLDVVFERPNRFTITDKASNQPPYKSISDGKNVYLSGEKVYYKNPIDKNAEGYHWYHNDLLLLLVTGSFDKAFELPVPPVKTVLPDDTWNGQSYHVIDLALGGGYPIDYKIYYGDDNVVRRIVHTEENGGRQWTFDVAVQSFEANPSVAKGTFSFTPAPGQKIPDTSAYRREETPLITVGRVAAPFALPTPQGPRLSLSEAMVGKKAVLLNFWFVHCPPCRAEHPKLERLYRDLKDQGLEILAIDDQDTPEAVAAYWKGAGLTFRTVLSGPMAAVNPKTGYPDYRGPKLPDYAQLVPYGVHACPTNVLLNAQGEVVYVSDGWDEPGLRKALEDLGVK